MLPESELKRIEQETKGYDHFISPALFKVKCTEASLWYERMGKFAEWATHNDWVYLPSKQKWYNEEDEENITPLTTPELINEFLKIK